MSKDDDRRLEVTVGNETIELDASDFPYQNTEGGEFTPEMRARLGASRELNRLRDRFGQYDLVEERAIVGTTEYDGGLELVEEYGMLADTGVLVRDDTGRVLLVRHPATEGWGHPSDMYRGESSLVETAEKTVRGATGIGATVTGFCYVREKQVTRDVDAEAVVDDAAIDPEEYIPPSYPMVTVIFSAVGTGEPRVPTSAAVTEARWFDEPPADTNPFTQRLLDRS